MTFQQHEMKFLIILQILLFANVDLFLPCFLASLLFEHDASEIQSCCYVY